MIRRTITTAIAVVALAGVYAANASAAVEVTNPGPITIDASFSMGVGQITYHYCDDSTFEGSTSSDGSISLDDIEFGSSAGIALSQSCDYTGNLALDDCSDAGAAGQIYAPGDTWYDQLQAGYGQLGSFDYDYVAVFEDWCVESDNWYGHWGTQDKFWGITGSGSSQEWTFLTPQGAWRSGWTITGQPTLTASDSVEVTSLN